MDAKNFPSENIFHSLLVNNSIGERGKKERENGRERRSDKLSNRRLEK